MQEYRPAVSNLNQETKKLLINVVKACQYEARKNRIHLHPEDFEDRVVFYTGIPRVTLQQIIYKDPNSAIYPKPDAIDFNNHFMILKSLSKLYERKEVPTFKLLLENVNEFLSTLTDQNLLDAKHFRQNIIMLGIDYYTVFNDTKLLMEDPKITFERYSYIKKIKQIRQQTNRVVYYVSEKIIDQNHNFNNPWNKTKHTSDISNGECVLFHAVSRNGFTNGLYCFSATEDDFYKWVVDILLGCLLPMSVVVMDNSPLHGPTKSKTITMFDTKSDMKKWLRNHNVPFSDTMSKSELYQLVKNHPNIDEVPRVDRVIKANGHQVLRLPTHFEDLSPIDHIWQDIKRYLEKEDDLHDEILSMLTNMPKQSYELYETDIAERENAMFTIDTEMDNALENFLHVFKDTAGDPSLSFLGMSSNTLE